MVANVRTEQEWNIDSAITLSLSLHHPFPRSICSILLNQAKNLIVMRRPYRQLPSSATDDCPAPGPPVARQQPQLLPFMLDTIISFYLEDYWGDPGEGKL